MPRTRVCFFRGSDGAVPVLEWLVALRQRNRTAFAKCMVRIERLEEAGHEIRRPEADFLRDGIHELRARHGTVQYRILYFFHARHAVVLAHSLVKEDRVPSIEIERAIVRKKQYERNPIAHTHEEPDHEQDQESRPELEQDDKFGDGDPPPRRGPRRGDAPCA